MLKNFPVKDHPDDGLIVDPADGNQLVFTVHDKHGNFVCNLGVGVAEKRAVARDIEHALIAARDIGFEQGRQHIRKALGIAE